MISREQYDKACTTHDESQKIINLYHKEQQQAFNDRMANDPVFTDDELRYSAVNLCDCGHGLAYPIDCGAFHYWDCSAILKGIADPTYKHTAKLDFTMTNIESESDHRGTTRGTEIRPNPDAQRVNPR